VRVCVEKKKWLHDLCGNRKGNTKISLACGWYICVLCVCVCVRERERESQRKIMGTACAEIRRFSRFAAGMCVFLKCVRVCVCVLCVRVCVIYTSRNHDCTVYVERDSRPRVSRRLNYRSLLQNIVSFIGLCGKRDL